MHFSIVQPPLTTPLTLVGVKNFLQETEEANDALINLLIDAACDYAEQRTNRMIRPTTIDQKLDTWPIDCDIKLRWNPLVSITHIKYKDSTGMADVTLDADDYYTYVENDITHIALKDKSLLSTINVSPYKAGITIRFVAGYDPIDRLHDNIKNALLLRIKKSYDGRDDSDLTTRAALMTAADNLLDMHKIYI